VAAQQSQKDWLSAAKRVLSKTHLNLTWDEFADLVGIERRAFKTYRLPEDSSNFRVMPPLATAAIKNLLQVSIIPPAESAKPPSTGLSLLIPSLAALVMRQARLALVEGKMVAGNQKSYGMPVGLLPEDRKAMSLVSHACLALGQPDWGSEIHQLLWQCTKPLGEWLPIQEVTELGYIDTRLIHAEDGTPTAEAEELSRDFSGITASIEDQLFTKLVEVLSRFPEKSANKDYTAVREFVVRNPVVRVENLRKSELDVSSQIWLLMQQQFYEPVPDGWNIGDGVPICAHCGNAMQQGKAGLVCRTQACTVSKPAAVAHTIKSLDLMRVTRGIRQYWIEPGLDEIQMYDAICKMGLPAELYPFRDRVDIAVGDIGIDLKAYSSPEILGRKFCKSIGGLAHYLRKWVVIPDWLIVAHPSYLDRLKVTAQRDELLFLKLSDALKLVKETTNA